MSKTYQKKTAVRNDGAVMPPLEAATIALSEIAKSAREGCWPSGRHRSAGDAGVDER